MFNYSKDIPLENVPKREAIVAEGITENTLTANADSSPFNYSMHIPLDDLTKS